MLSAKCLDTADVCYLRLDFATFNILGTGSTVDADCQDMFTVTVSGTVGKRKHFET